MDLFSKLGRFFFASSRASLFFVALAIPIAIAFALLIPRFLSLLEMEKDMAVAALRSKSALEKRRIKEAFLQQYANPEPYFIDKHLETLPLLQKELAYLRQIEEHPACANRAELQKRISFLQTSKNRLAFAEEAMRSSPRVKETDEKLLHPVEVDWEDLERILSLVEHVKIGSHAPVKGSPQLILSNFSLTKKKSGSYELDLSLLKREFQNHDQKKP